LSDGNESITTNEDTPASGLAGALLANTVNPDGPSAASITQFTWGSNVDVVAGNTATITGVGTLVVNANGAYTFTPAADYDGTVPSATYDVTDGADTVTSTLAISITGVNDPPTLVVSSNDDGEVDEAAIDASGAGAPVNAGTGVGEGDQSPLSLTSTGTISFTATEGFDHIKIVHTGGSTNVTIGGTADPIVGEHGTLSIGAFSGPDVDGKYVATYTYTLTSAEDHRNEDGKELFTVQVFDSDGVSTTQPTALDIAINDDAPIPFDPFSGYAAPGGSIAGALNFSEADTAPGANNVGADGLRAANSVVFTMAAGSAVTDVYGNNVFYGAAKDALTWVKVSDVEFQAQTVGGVKTAVTATLDGKGDSYSVVLGSEVFSLEDDDTPFAPGEGTVTGGNKDYFGITDLGGGIVDVVVSSDSDSVNTNAESFGVGNAKSINTGENIILDFFSNSLLFDSTNTTPELEIAPTVLLGEGINNFEFSIIDLGNSLTEATFKVETFNTVRDINGVVSYTSVEAFGSDLVPLTALEGESYTVSTSNGATYDHVVITAVGGNANGQNFSLTLDGFSEFSPSDISLNLGVRGYDSEGDFADGDVVFGIDQAADTGMPDLPNILHASIADEVLSGTSGETDIFAWELADVADAPEGVADTVTGFDVSSDTLDLRDLLQSEDNDLGGDVMGNLDNYLNVTLSGDDTVVEISSTGGFSGGVYNPGAVDQVITLTDVDLVTAHGGDLESIIQSMLTNGQLITD
jgi:hypothetical protein